MTTMLSEREYLALTSEQQLQRVRKLSSTQRNELACGLSTLDRFKYTGFDVYNRWLYMWSSWDAPAHSDDTLACYAACAHAATGDKLRYKDYTYTLGKYKTVSWEHMKDHIVAIIAGRAAPRPSDAVDEVPPAAPAAVEVTKTTDDTKPAQAAFFDELFA